MPAEPEFTPGDFFKISTHHGMSLFTIIDFARLVIIIFIYMFVLAFIEKLAKSIFKVLTYIGHSENF